MVGLYKRNMGAATGLSIIPKLKYEHIKLTSFSKMRVDLAAQVQLAVIKKKCVYLLIIYDQVLSDSVGEALYLTGGKEAFETGYFIKKIDKFFDCFNVSWYNQGKLKRKPFQQPYRSEKDFRLEVAIL